MVVCGIDLEQGLKGATEQLASSLPHCLVGMLQRVGQEGGEGNDTLPIYLIPPSFRQVGEEVGKEGGPGEPDRACYKSRSPSQRPGGHALHHCLGGGEESSLRPSPSPSSGSSRSSGRAEEEEEGGRGGGHGQALAEVGGIFDSVGECVFHEKGVD